MPLAHICTRGIPIIYYQRKILLTPYRFAYNIFIPTFLLWHEIGWGGTEDSPCPIVYISFIISLSGNSIGRAFFFILKAMVSPLPSGRDRSKSTEM